MKDDFQERKERAGGTPYSEEARVATVKRAERWTDEQAERLGATPAEIVEAIRARGWLPDQIEALRIAQADDLQRVPLCENLRAGVERIRTAPVATP